MSQRGILIGGGAFGREVLDWIEPLVSGGKLPAFSAFLDSDAAAMDQFAELGMTAVGDPFDYQPQNGDLFVMAIGTPAAKADLAKALVSKGAIFATIIHPSAVVSSRSTIGSGVVIGPHVYVATNARLDDFVSINSLSGIGHDAVVETCATVSSQVDLMGGARVGAAAFVGSGARILPGVAIGSTARVGAGAVVIRDVKDGNAVFAAPARKI